MITDFIVNGLLSLAIVAALFGVFTLAWHGLRTADAGHAGEALATDEHLPYAA